jgi:hypothetical protein
LVTKELISAGNGFIVTRTLQSTQKAARLEMKTLDSTIEQVDRESGEV